MFDQPIVFEPIFMERVWGGRELGTRLGKRLPEGMLVGESWELSDRPEAQSRVAAGEWQGHTLHDLWSNHREGLFGRAYGDSPAEHFPLLIKLLDARETLSVQVHPPPAVAPELGGEPKTEMWYFLDTDPDACIFVGVRAGETRDSFRRRIEQGEVEDALIRLPVTAGDSIFIPSGRLHAIGAGCLIAEIQQNSDTTYRVYDWNRAGLDGKPRELHREQSLRSIDFSDHAPQLLQRDEDLLAECPWFRVEKRDPRCGPAPDIAERFAVWAVTRGGFTLCGRHFQTGDFLLLPCGFHAAAEQIEDTCEVLEIVLPVPSFFHPTRAAR